MEPAIVLYVFTSVYNGRHKRSGDGAEVSVFSCGLGVRTHLSFLPITPLSAELEAAME